MHRSVLAVLFLALSALGAACGAKAPVKIDPPPAQTILPEDVPKHVDAIVGPLMAEFLMPVRTKLRAAKVLTPVQDSDSSYEVWVNAVGGALYDGEPLPKNIDKLSQRAYKDLARLLGR